MSNGTKKSEFSALTSVEDSSTFDFVINGTNYKITKENLVAAFGTTGTLEQDGDPTAVPVLNTVGTVNKIRNIEPGPGILASISSENGITLSHNLSSASTGTPVLTDVAEDSPLIRSLVAGTDISLTVVGDTIVIASTATDPVITALGVNAGTTVSIAALNTPVRITSNWTYSHLDSFLSPTSGKLVYTGTDEAHVSLMCTISVDIATATDDCSFYFYKNGIQESDSKITRELSAGNVGNLTLIWAMELVTDDYVEIFAENNDASVNIIVHNAILNVAG